MNPSRAILVSHKEDLDGIISAVLIKHWLLTQGISESQISVYLVNYNELPNILDQILPNITTSWFAMTDLGLNLDSIKQLTRFPIFSQSTPTRIYIDHHAIGVDRQFLDTRFNLYLNPDAMSIEERKKFLHEGLQMTGAVLTRLVFYSNQYSIIIPLHVQYPVHFNELVQYAFEMDHLEHLSHSPHPLAVKIKKYISFYQNDQSNLLQLLDILRDPDSYLQFIQNLDKELAKIDAWYEQQQELIGSTFIMKNDRGVKFIAASSELRAGEITQHLLKIQPQCDIYIGVSTKEKYMNIRTTVNTLMFLNRFTEPLKGGGHENRAGFPIPTQYVPLFSEKTTPKTFPPDLLDFLIQHFHQIHAASLSQKV